MAWRSSFRLSKLPSRIASSVMSRKNLSITFIHELLVGVKCKTIRSDPLRCLCSRFLFSIQRPTGGVLWVA